MESQSNTVEPKMSDELQFIRHLWNLNEHLNFMWLHLAWKRTLYSWELMGGIASCLEGNATLTH